MFIKDDSSKAMIEAAHKKTMIEVNKLVVAAYSKALETSKNADGTTNIARLNKALDKARKSIMPEAHTLLTNNIVKHTGVILSEQYLTKGADGRSLKELAECTTATANDVLHTDHDQGLATLIAGSEFTAHHRIKGADFAHRQIITQKLDAKEHISPSDNPRIQIRTPSPVMKKGFTDESDYINDVSTKLSAVRKTYELAENLESGSTAPRAFIYNRYTAINDALGDIGGNLQTQSAIHILKGAHAYNKSQYVNSREIPVLCLVQNISVNGFGDELSYNSGNELIEESTLMAELALVHTLYGIASKEDKAKISAIFTQYKNYLRAENSPEFFSQSQEGKNAQASIKALKEAWKTTHVLSNEDHLTNIKGALRNMVANNLHFSHEFSKLIQTMSVFVEEASIGGCKSGNERAQAINGRVAVLDSLFSEKQADEIKDIKSKLKNLAQSANPLSLAQDLKKAIDTEYNKQGLQGAASLISLIDQGASAKVEAKPNHGFYISRNYAEEQADTMTHLSQSKSGMMQAHKALTQHMKLAWEGHPVSWWSHMTSSPLGVIGAILGVITIIPALLVAMYTAIDNEARKEELKQSHLGLRDEYHSNLKKPQMNGLFAHGKIADKENIYEKQSVASTYSTIDSQSKTAPRGLLDTESNESESEKETIASFNL